jgi:hypothetical protein
MRLWEADEFNFDQITDPNATNTMNATDSQGPTILQSLNSVKLIDKIDRSLKTVYEDIISSSSVFSTLDQKVQRMEIEDFSKTISKAKKKVGLQHNEEYTQDELQTRNLLNASSNNLLGNFTDFIVSGERKKRYQTYDEIPDLNYIAFRMFDVYIQNIFVKNIQTKKFLFINENPNYTFRQDQEVLKEQYKSLIKTLIAYFDLENKLKNFIVPKTLKYGNYFIEIVNFDKLEDFINSTSLLQESDSFYHKYDASTRKEYDRIKDYIIIESVQPLKSDIIQTGESRVDATLLENSLIDEIKESGSISPLSFELRLKQFLMENKPSVLIEENIFDFFDQQNNGDQKTEDYSFDELLDLDITVLQNIQLRGIDPSKVIIVEDESILYGYIIIEDESSGNNSNEVDIYKRFLSDGGNGKQNTSKENMDETIKKLTKYINDNIIEIIRRSNKNFKFDSLELPEDSLFSIKSILYNKIKEKSKLKFRFLSSNNMVNFSTPVNKYAPYGTSIFDPIVQPVKLYTLALISSIISRLSRASVVRKWNIEAGSKKNHAEIVESVKRDLKNKSITFDNLSNIKNIANVLTDFRDLATIKIDGQSFIDMEIVPMHDRALPLNDANDLRNDLIAATGVPSVYLNIGDQADLREQLINLNTSFANNILNQQTNIEDGVNKVLSILFTELLKANNKKNNTFNLTSYFESRLTAPLILQVQSNEALISSITNIIGMFKSAEFTVNPKQLYKLFIPTMDWDDLETQGKQYIQEKAKANLMGQADNGGNY